LPKTVTAAAMTASRITSLQKQLHYRVIVQELEDIMVPKSTKPILEGKQLLYPKDVQIKAT